MNIVLSRRVSLIPARGLPTILSPTIGGATGDRPAVRRVGLSPCARSTGFVFYQQTRPRSPTESSSRCLCVSRRYYGLVVLVPLLSTPPCGDAVTVPYPTAPRRRGTDSHRSVPAPSQAHEWPQTAASSGTAQEHEQISGTAERTNSTGTRTAQEHEQEARVLSSRRVFRVGQNGAEKRVSAG